MGKIKDYDLDASLTGGEKLLATDVDESTVNILLSKVAIYTSDNNKYYKVPLQDSTALIALTEASLTDKARVYVEDELSDYFYDAEAVSGNYTPTDQTGGTGFWIKGSSGGGGATQLSELTDVVSATNTAGFVLKANGTTGYVGQALLLADVSDYSGAQIEADLDSEIGHVRWKAVEVPSGGTSGQVLQKTTNNNYDVNWVTLGGGGDALVANPLSQFAATTSTLLRGVISDETGSGSLVFNTSPTLVTPSLGVPTALTLTNATGLPSSGISGLTATTAELNLLGLSGLTSGWVLSADSATTASWKANVGGTPLPVTDTSALVKGSSDVSKLVRIEADTNVPVSTTVAIIAPSSDLDLEDVIISDESVVPNGVKINNIVAAPTSDIEGLASPDPNTIHFPTDAKAYEYVQIITGNLTDSITTGISKGFDVSPVTGTIVAVYVDMFTAGSSTGITIDINKNATTILSTKLTTDATEQSSRTASVPAVISVSAISEGDRISIDHDAVPTGGRHPVITIKIEKS